MIRYRDIKVYGLCRVNGEGSLFYINYVYVNLWIFWYICWLWLESKYIYLYIKEIKESIEIKLVKLELGILFVNSIF